MLFHGKRLVDNSSNKLLNAGMDNLKRAIDAVGSQSELARLLGVLPQHVNNWKTRGVPPDRCPAIESVSGVRCEDLRSDMQWNRDADGRVTGYTTPVAAPSADTQKEVRNAA